MSFTVSLLATAVVIADVGVARYGAIALVWSIPALLPFLDLGLGSWLVNAVNDDDGRDEKSFDAAFNVAFRSLVVVAIASVMVGILFGVLGLWPRLLGRDATALPHLSLAVGGMLAILGISLPASLGYRVMQGRGRNDIATRMQAWVPIIGLVIVLTVRYLHGDAFLYGISTITGVAVVAWWCLRESLHMSARSLRQILKAHVAPGVREQVRRFGINAFVVSAGLAIALQSDRVILSHVADRTQLAKYSMAAQLYAPIWGMIATVGVLLWPHYRDLMRDGTHGVSVLGRHIVAFGISGVIVAGCYVALADPVSRTLSRGQISVDLPIRLAFAALLIIQSLQLPSGMLLTDESGMRLQARLVLAMCVLNLASSWILARHWGATGPVVASALCVGVVQLWPTARHAFRLLRSAARTA